MATVMALLQGHDRPSASRSAGDSAAGGSAARGSAGSTTIGAYAREPSNGPSGPSIVADPSVVRALKRVVCNAALGQAGNGSAAVLATLTEQEQFVQVRLLACAVSFLKNIICLKIFIRSLTHSLAHSPNHSPTHLLIHSRAYSLDHPFTCPRTHKRTNALPRLAF